MWTSTSIIMHSSFFLVICLIFLDAGSKVYADNDYEHDHNEDDHDYEHDHNEDDHDYAKCEHAKHRNKRVCEPTQKEHWSYEGANGPKNWPELHPDFCNGSSQSPIDIQINDVKVDDNLGELQCDGYDQNLTDAEIQNNGHSVQVTPKDGVIRTISGAGLTGSYKFSQLHFHWGSNREKGSEHTINKTSYPLEIHLVHRNDEGKLAVLGVLCKETPQSNKNLDPIFETLQKLKYKGDRQNISTGLKLKSLLPNENSFYRYEGSLTTPDCSEGVTWTVFNKTIEVGRLQLTKLRGLYSTERGKERCRLVNNFRPVQPLNNRPVTSNFKP